MRKLIPFGGNALWNQCSDSESEEKASVYQCRHIMLEKMSFMPTCLSCNSVQNPTVTHYTYHMGSVQWLVLHVTEHLISCIQYCLAR